MNTVNCNIDRQPSEVTREPQIVNGRHRDEVIVKMASKIIGAALWTGAWVVTIGYIVGWLRF